MRDTAAVQFIEAFCRHSKGEWAGQPFILLPWQRKLVNELMAVERDGLRRYRTAYVGLPRKNGKSTLCSALALYGLLADKEAGAEVYCVAGDRRQAEIVFSEAKRMVLADRDLAAVVRIQRYHLEGPNNAVLRVLSADAALQQGLNPSFTIFDEVHVQKTDALWHAMTLGSGTRRQPLVIAITTAGFDEATLAYRLYQHGREVEAGAVDDPTFFFRWWAAPDALDYRDPAAWRAANPALGAFLKAEDFATQVRSTPESAFRRFRLNQWVTSEQFWLPAGLWEGQADASRTLDPRRPIAVGIDPAYSDDTFAVVVAQRQGEDTILRARFFLNPYPPGHSAREGWVVDHEEVRGYLRQLRQAYPVAATEIDGHTIAGPAYVFDPSSFTESAQILESEGLAMIEVPQTDPRMVPATRLFYDLLVDHRVWHDGDPILAAHLRNAVAIPRGENGWRLRKATKSSQKKIDGAIASVMAVFQAAEPAPPARVGAFLV